MPAQQLYVHERDAYGQLILSSLRPRVPCLSSFFRPQTRQKIASLAQVRRARTANVDSQDKRDGQFRSVVHASAYINGSGPGEVHTSLFENTPSAVFRAADPPKRFCASAQLTKQGRDAVMQKKMYAKPMLYAA
jgi:hypothetical protein